MRGSAQFISDKIHTTSLALGGGSLGRALWEATRSCRSLPNLRHDSRTNRYDKTRCYDQSLRDRDWCGKRRYSLAEKGNIIRHKPLTRTKEYTEGLSSCPGAIYQAASYEW